MANIDKAGINLTLQGEAQYIAGLRNINREMDLMATNTKLAVAQLGRGASPTKRFNTQMNSLGAEIEKASTQTMVLRNRNKELPDTIFKTGKSLDDLKDKYEDQSGVVEELGKKRDELTHYQLYETESGKELNEQYNKQVESARELEGEIDKLEGAYNNMLDEYEQMPNSMADAQLATQNLLNEQERLREEYLKSGGVLAGFADKLDSGSEKLQRYGRTVSDIGDSMMWVTGAIVAGGGGALMAFMDWESALRGAMKTNDEVVDSNGDVTYSYEDLETGLRELSTEIPVANTELAELAEIAGRLQVPTDEVVEFTEVVAKLGETTNLTSEDAAEQLGKFINITGSGSDTVLNLANALVELGNNTAASERETLRMSTRWASTGDIIGLTDDQILALSASVISLGIRTEAGGSAVQRSFLKINDAVLEGGDTLASFAETAGMSSEEFQKAWQDDAAQALIPFLEGLNETHEAGGNVNSILRDLGITSVNELNTLLVLAGGYDQLAGNLEMASDAYNETEESMMALNEEAELAYGTTLGKLRTAWNKLKDSLIDIGEPIADAVIDMVDAADPIFDTIENIATGFSEMDESAQRDILNTVAKIALIAPALKLAGGTMTTLGDIGQAVTPLVRKSGEIITGAFTGVSDEASTLADTAQTAGGAKGVGGLVKILSGSGAGALPWALGIAAVALGGWTLWKTWGEDAYEAAQRTRDWGTDVGEATADVLDDTQETLGTFNLLQEGVSVDSDLMVSDFQKMGQSIEDDINRKLLLTEEYISGLPEVLGTAVNEMLSEYQKDLQETNEVIKANNEEVTRIQQKASKENRELTAEELAYINELQRYSMDEYIGILDITAEEEKNIRKALSGDVESITKEQTLNMIAMLNDENKAIEANRQEDLKSTKEYLDERNLLNTAAGDEILEAVNEYYDSMGESGQQTMQELFSLYPELAETHNLATGEMLSSSDRIRRGQLANNRRLVESWEESHVQMGAASKELENVQELMIDGTKRGAQEWNKMIMESAGSFETFREKVLEAAQTEEGWNQLQFRIHDAELDSNAKAVIMEAAIANGEWDSLEYGSKRALLKDNFSLTVYDAIEASGLWDALTPEEKVATLKNEFGQTVADAIVDMGTWDALDPDVQTAILTTNTPETLQQTLEDIGKWETLPIKIRKLFADNTPVKEETKEAGWILDKYGNIIVDKPTLEARNNVRPGVSAAQRIINSLRGKTVTLTTKRVTRHITRGNPSSHHITALHNARGTDFHPGGLAMVNDQQGATFRELVTLPDGSSFVPSGRDVLLDLPKGSKVLRAALTKMKFPDIKQYQDGVGYSRQQTQQIMNGNNVDMSQTNGLLRTLINLISDGQVIQMDGNEVGRTIYSTIDSTMNNNMQRSQIMNV